MNLLLVAITVAAISAPSPATAPLCDGILDGARLRIAARWGDINSFPTGGWIGYSSADTIVTCRIGERGRLADCISPLRDARGRWLEGQLRRWKALDEASDGCPLIGRSVRFEFRLDMEMLVISARLDGRLYRWNVLD